MSSFAPPKIFWGKIIDIKTALSYIVIDKKALSYQKGEKSMKRQKIRWLWCLIVVGLFFVGCSGVRLPIAQNDRWGYTDKSGNVIIPYQFDEALPFTEGLAAVKVAKRWGFIDGKGSFVINPSFDGALPFSEGVSGVKSGNRWGFIDHKGNMVIPLQFDHVDSFAEGYAMVKLGERIGYIDLTGKYIINPR